MWHMESPREGPLMWKALYDVLQGPASQIQNVAWLLCSFYKRCTAIGWYSVDV